MTSDTPTAPPGNYVMHGMMCSYYTKKLEAYFRAKGIPHLYVETDGPDFVQCGVKVGVTQIPQVERPDGTWLTDTTLIMEHFESDDTLPAIRPKDPVVAFCSDFLEDCFDEWFWAPAMYYRWAFKMDCIRRSEEFSYTILSNSLPLPRWLLKRYIEWRQKSVHLKGNGIVTSAHAKQIEEMYIDSLDLLQPVFEKQPYLFGERPCEADFGLFGPMFPHFSCDPTPQEIMHVRAPHLVRWLGRLWSTQPDEIQAAPAITQVPEELKPFIRKMAQEYLPYLIANQEAFQSDEGSTRYHLHGLEWKVKTAPYRVYCLSQLQQRYQALTPDDQHRVATYLGEDAKKILGQTVRCPAYMQQITASRPAQNNGKTPLSRQWHSTGFTIDKLNEDVNLRRQSKAVPEAKRSGTSWLPIYFRRYRAG